MPRAHVVRPIVFVVTTLFILLIALRLTAQKQTTEKTSDYGPGSTITTYYNPDGTVYRKEYADPKGKLRIVSTYSYDPDTHKLIEINHLDYRAEDGTLLYDDMDLFDANGRLVKTVLRKYDSQGNQTSSSIWDWVDKKGYVWDPATGTYQEVKATKTETPSTPPDKKIGNVSYEPTELGMIVPANLQAGDTFSGTVMPANEAKNYSSVPGFTVKTFTVSLQGGQFSGADYQGLNIGSEDSGPQRVVDGHFTLTVPPGTSTLSLIARQEYQPKDPTFTTNLSLGAPAWAREPVISPPVWNGGDLNYWLGALNYLWFKVTDYEEEYWDAYNDGAPDWVLDEIEDDQDDAQDAADFLAYHLPLDAVRNVAEAKAVWEHWLDIFYHGGMSYVHKDNEDYYLNYAVPQDYYVRDAFHALVAPPILQVGRLGVLRGDFSGDCGSTRVDVDGLPVRFMASNLHSYYFMPPETVTPGAHTLNVQNGMFRYAFPVFFMRLMMSIDTANLHTKIFPTSTHWHLTLTGFNGMPSSNWTGGGVNPDLVSLSDLGTLPSGFQMPDQTRQGNIFVTVSNLSTTVIALSEVPGGQRTWVLNAQNFAPAGEFHIDGDAKALRDGVFNIHGLAVAALKPISGNPMPPWGSSWGPLSPWQRPVAFAPLSSPFKNVSYRLGAPDTSPAQQAQEAGQAYLAAQKNTKTKRLAMIDQWKKASSESRPPLRSAYEAAGKEYGVAFKAWRDSEKECKANPSDENRKKLAQLKQERLKKKLAFEAAREVLLNGMNPTTHQAWLAAQADYKNAAETQAHARIGLETAWRAVGAAK